MIKFVEYLLSDIFYISMVESNKFDNICSKIWNIFLIQFLRNRICSKIKNIQNFKLPYKRKKLRKQNYKWMNMKYFWNISFIYFIISSFTSTNIRNIQELSLDNFYTLPPLKKLTHNWFRTKCLQIFYKIENFQEKAFAGFTC